jgi:hypothetical protein
MSIKDAIKLLIMHIFYFILGTALFVLFFYTRLFGNINVLFYRGILLLVTTCVVITILLILFKRSRLGKLFTYRDIILSVTIIFSFNIVFFTHLPATAERSISVFLLGYMNKNPDKAITKEEFTRFFIDKYINEYGAMEKRFNEQIVSGNIVSKGKGYLITKQGRLIMRFYNLIADLFKIEKRIISP